ncbi:MAG: hypothetical protein WB439_02175 [Acidobacteriaceae bacterium]
MTFSSRATIIVTRAFQWLMLVFTWMLFTKNFPDPTDKMLWCSVLLVWEWLCYNMVQAKLDSEAVTYRRWRGPVRVPWDSVASVTLWRGIGGIMIGMILRLDGRSLLTRYKFLFDSKPGIEILRRAPSVDDPAGLAQLRDKLVGQI